MDKESELKGQLELIAGYIGRIDLGGWAIEQVRDSLSKDLEYLQQEFGLLQTTKIIENMGKVIPLMFKIGDKVKVIRQIGKSGTPTEVTGEIIRFPQGIQIAGEKVAEIKYDDGIPSYVHAISKIQLIDPHPKN